VDYVGVSEIASRYGVPPRVISDLLYGRVLDDQRCPLVAGRRLIPVDYLPVIGAVLRDRDARRRQSRAPKASS
jgi:hypothetical protein